MFAVYFFLRVTDDVDAIPQEACAFVVPPCFLLEIVNAIVLSKIHT
jgi:hypothetical protein